MPFVLDASVAACWAFEDEVHPTAAFALARLLASDAVVPCLWWFELRSTLVVNGALTKAARAVNVPLLRAER